MPAAPAARDHQRQLIEGPRARSRRAPPGARRTLTSRVSPVGSIQSPASMPANAGAQRLRDLADGEAERSGEPAVDHHVELRLLALRRQPDVHRAGHLPHLVGDGSSASPDSSRDVRTLAAAAGSALIAERSGARSTPSRRRAAAARARSSARHFLLLAVALGLRLEPHVDRALVHRARSARRWSCRCRRPPAAPARSRRFLGLEPRVLRGSTRAASRRRC